MTSYFRDRIREQRKSPRDGLIHSLLTAEIDGDGFQRKRWWLTALSP